MIFDTRIFSVSTFKVPIVYKPDCNIASIYVFCRVIIALFLIKLIVNSRSTSCFTDNILTLNSGKYKQLFNIILVLFTKSEIEPQKFDCNIVSFSPLNFRNFPRYRIIEK